MNICWSCGTKIQLSIKLSKYRLPDVHGSLLNAESNVFTMVQNNHATAMVDGVPTSLPKLSKSEQGTGL
jgi:hypothetical protein